LGYSVLNDVKWPGVYVKKSAVFWWIMPEDLANFLKFDLKGLVKHDLMFGMDLIEMVPKITVEVTLSAKMRRGITLILMSPSIFSEVAGTSFAVSGFEFCRSD